MVTTLSGSGPEAGLYQSIPPSLRSAQRPWLAHTSGSLACSFERKQEPVGATSYCIAATKCGRSRFYSEPLAVR